MGNPIRKHHYKFNEFCRNFSEIYFNFLILWQNEQLYYLFYMQTKILVIDDEEPLCEILRYNLEKEGYEVDYALSAEEALEKDLMPYQLFITDIMMDKMSGFDFAKKIKNHPALESKPIIFCSALNGEHETVMGLNIGADDYITKPFVIGEVIARVRAVLRRAGQQLNPYQPSPVEPAVTPLVPKPLTNPTVTKVKYKTLEINTDEKSCYLDNKLIKLTKTEYDLLLFFLTHRNKIYSREEIIKAVWGPDVVVSSRAIDTNITRLRIKIGEYKPNIVTRNGFGYGFQEEV